jgi:hypothetical protein
VRPYAEEVEMNTPADTAPDLPEHPDAAARGDRDNTPTPTAPAPPTATAPIAPIAPAPILPTQSREDTDVGWGDYAERDDNDRLLRDRPPHWDNA